MEQRKEQIMKRVNTRWFYILAIAMLAVILACSASLSLGDSSRDEVIGNEGGATVNVEAKDFSFALDASQAEAGAITFVVQNNGSTQHDFAIRSNGVEQKTPMIRPGESARFTVELEPGAYSYVCTIPGHEQLGMNGNFTVTSN
jgi:nitrite reductase (NO-forming)